MCAKAVKDKSETPLMKQYYSVKAQYPGALLLFRVGDFYETFDEDARIASKTLGIVLTKRANGAASEMDLAGFPYHSLDSYLPKLVKAGLRVAICEQLEDPKMTKTIVKRGVTELVTPGVSYNDKVLDAKTNNFLSAFWIKDQLFGVSFLDISTGDFYTTEGNFEIIEKLINGFKPAEILIAKGQQAKCKELLGNKWLFETLDDWIFQTAYGEEKLTRQFKAASLKGFGIAEMPVAIAASGAILQYLEHTQHNQISHIQSISRIEEEKYVWLDAFTIRNLELVQTIFPGGKSLFETIDKTCTPMGARLLRNWIVMPIKEIPVLQERLQIVDFFTKFIGKLDETRMYLEKIGDLQRLASKIALKRISPRELFQVGCSLQEVQKISTLFNQTESAIIHNLASKLEDCSVVIAKILNSIKPEAPLVLAKGNIFQEGVNQELDYLRNLAYSGKDYLIEIQRRESESTGIPSLKISFNNVFGYYLEVTNSHKDKVPADWIRKQTLTNAERYITPELKEYEEKILNAEESISKIETKLWDEILLWLEPYLTVIQKNAQVIGMLDCLCGFAQISLENNYIKPEINEGLDLELLDCRHPVIEQQLPPDESFIPNNIVLNHETQRIMIITGPNMSGKSAVLRQTALNIIMAQIGCFVPCKSAKIGVVDKIYTRVGASDNISLGESTFMVEMLETASILNNLSKRSLVILDEIGRGTSTYDGVSLAWSMVEYLQSHALSPKTMFATHYHELNELESKLDGIKNFHISIKEAANTILFLRKLTPGGSEHSFGIHVAQMAGIPNKVLLRANEILAQLENDRASISGRETLKKTKAQPVFQLNMFGTEDPKIKILNQLLEKVDINSISPIDALLKLQEIKLKLNN